jgi:hypothetical protein
MKSNYKDFTTCQLYTIFMDFSIIKNNDFLQILYDVEFLNFCYIVHTCTK